MRELFLILVIFTLMVSAGCAGVSTPIGGAIYTSVYLPVDAETTADKGYAVKGVACASNYLGLFALGDASLKAAKDSAGIKSVVSVDYKVDSFLNFYARYCTIVRGYY